MRKVMICILVLLLIAGCDGPVGGKMFFEEIHAMERLLDHPDWEGIEKKGKRLQERYDQDKWKLQLLGDEGEYEAINESLYRLKAAIREKDTLEVRTELASIKAFLRDIYSL